MAQDGKPNHELSPADILTELVVEGASSFIEAQRIFLNLAQQENEIIMSAVKGQIAGSPQGVAMIDLARRSLDTFINMHEDFLTATSKQTLHWIEAVKAGKSYDATHLTHLAKEEWESFVKAQRRFLDVVAEETQKAASGKHEHAAKTVIADELPKLAREAANSFIDAQKRLLDVLGQQMNVNLSAASRTIELLSPSRLWPMAKRTGEAVKSFAEAEKSLFESMAKPQKRSKAAHQTSHKARASRTVKVQPVH